MNDISSFGEWVKQRRKLMDFTQAMLAERVGCAVSTIKKIEQDERRPSREMAELLAEHLAVPQPERVRFISMARGQFTNAASSADALRFPSFLQAQHHKSPTRFVARRHELAQLQAHLDQVLTGDSRVVFISGEAGRGKTSLLAEFARQAQLNRSDLIVAEGVCSAHGNIGDPYLPFRDVLAQLSGDVETRMAASAISPEQAHRLWDFLPHTITAIVEHGPNLLNTLLSGAALLKRISPYTTGQPDWLVQLQDVIEQQQTRQAHLEQHQLFEQIRQVLQTLATQRPLLLLFDDLQWIDSASLNLLFHLGRRLTGGRILLVGAYRGSEVDDAHPLASVISEFKRRWGDIQLDLEQFDPLTSRNFVDLLLNTESNQLSEQFREKLLWHTKGHPLFTVELLRHLQERGNLIKDNNGRWIESAAFESSDLPVRIEAVINQRLSRLDAALQELLKVAAVEGEVFTAQVACHIQQLDERAILQQLSELEQDHRLVREHSEIQVGERYLNRYQFSHVLFQHYLYQQLSQGERRLLHTSIARALAELYQQHAPDIAVQLAHHYTQAGAHTQATAYHRMAGDQALNGAALEEAIHYYRAALSGWPAQDEAGLAAIQRNLGECLWATGQLSAARETFERCYDLFQKLGDRIGSGAAQRLIGRIYWEQGERALSLQHYHQALSILENEPESIELAQALSAISLMHMLASEYEQSIVWGERALALAEKLDAQEVVVHASNNIGVSLTALGNTERGLALLWESYAQALSFNIPVEVCRAHVNLGESLIWHGRYAEADDIFEKMLAYAIKAGTTVFQGVALVRLTELDWWQGRWATALTRCGQIRIWYEELQGATVPKVWASTLLGWIYNDLDRPQLAHLELERELNTARSLDEMQTTLPHLGQLARSMAALEREDETITLLQEFLSLLKRTPSGHSYSIAPLLFACRWLAQHPVRAPSLDMLHSCLSYLEKIETQCRSQESRAALAEAKGIQSLVNNEATIAVEQFQQAATAWENLSRPYDHARALNALGQALLQTGDIRQAQAVFDQAFGIIETLAAQLEDAELKASFLDSSIVQEIRAGQSRRSR